MSSKPRQRFPSPRLSLLDPRQITLPSDRPPTWARSPTRALVAEVGFHSYELLVGADAIAASASHRHPVRALIIHGLTRDQIDRVRDSVQATGASPGSFVGLVGVLTELGIATTAIAQVLPVARSEVSRLRAAAQIPALADSLACGEITHHHARHLLRLPRGELLRKLDLCLELGWSPAELAQHLSGTAATHSTAVDAKSGDANLTEEEVWLSGQLGASTRISSTGGSGDVVINWSTMADLLGIMERLGSAPNPEDGLPVHRRELRIQFRSLDEYEALVGHMRDP